MVNNMGVFGFEECFHGSRLESSQWI
jgi:hypothetical protein